MNEDSNMEFQYEINSEAPSTSREIATSIPETSTSSFHDMIDFTTLGSKKKATKSRTERVETIPTKNYYGVLANLDPPNEPTTPNNTKAPAQKSKVEKTK